MNKLRYELIIENNSCCSNCKVCFKQEESKLHLHHIDHNRSHNHKSNLILLCMKCHYKLHGEFKTILSKKLNDEKYNRYRMYFKTYSLYNITALTNIKVFFSYDEVR